MNNICNNRGILEHLIHKHSIRGQIGNAKTDSCECFTVGKRSIKSIPFSLTNPYLESWKKEIAHHHGIFANTSENIGFGGNGIFKENIKDFDYTGKKTCYDGNLAR